MLDCLLERRGLEQDGTGRRNLGGIVLEDMKQFDAFFIEILESFRGLTTYLPCRTTSEEHSLDIGAMILP
jgi:hypothetical protein